MLDKNGGTNLSVQISKIKVLEKYKKDLCNSNVRFCDVSHYLITKSVLSKDDCFEICGAPLKKQMQLFYEKLLKILEIDEDNGGDSSVSDNSEKSENPEPKTKDVVKDPWDIFIRAVKSEHPLLASRMDIKPDSKPRRLTRDDIGTPLHFKHLHHIGEKPEKPRRFLSLRSTSSSSSLDESDPDFQAFLAKVGVTEEQFQRPGTRRVILDFVEKNGGIDAIREELRDQENNKSDPSESENSSLIVNE